MFGLEETRQKQALMNAIFDAEDRLEGLFVGDNVRMLSVWARTKKLHGLETADFGTFADRLAEDMDGISGASFQWQTNELIEMLEDYD